MQYFKKIYNKLTTYRLSKQQQADAQAAAMLTMIKILVSLLVKTTYGLKHELIAEMFRQSAEQLSNAAKNDDKTQAEKAILLNMSMLINDVASDLRFEGTKHASRNHH